MISQIDVHDLAEEDIQVVQEWINQLRNKTHGSIENPDSPQFGEWELGIKGNLSRKELYED